MPVKQFTTTADPRSMETLQVTIANLLHAAGVTMAVSPRGAELIARIAKDWFDGQYERAVVDADAAGRELRQMRACPRPRVPANQTLPAAPCPADQADISPAPDQTAPRTSHQAQPGRPLPAPIPQAMGCWSIRVTARHESVISCDDLCAAIAMVADQLPRHITSVRVTETAPL